MGRRGTDGELVLSSLASPRHDIHLRVSLFVIVRGGAGFAVKLLSLPPSSLIRVYSIGVIS